MENDDYRSLSIDEISLLERQGCTAEDWECVSVAEDFEPAYIRNVSFGGNVELGVFEKNIDTGHGIERHSGLYNVCLRDVRIGDDCLIENIAGHISRYTIGSGCYISGVGRITGTSDYKGGTFETIAVINEGGKDNIMLFRGLTSQLAALMMYFTSDRSAWYTLRDICRPMSAAHYPTIGCEARITDTGEISDSDIGDHAVVAGALRISGSDIAGSDVAPAVIGSGVVCERSVVAVGARLTDVAKVYRSFIGEAVSVGRGFTSESSLFFANSHMDNGEACAAFCGPFTVSHHKSTLLIGARYSFYNAGSATNFSNHAYKMGPIHRGTLMRGSKTASGCHILWPAAIGAFSVCLGKIQTHPFVCDLPFSYVIGDGRKTYIVPGRNIATVGTYRDITKWLRRDARTGSRRDIINQAWLSPYIMQYVLKGRRILIDLRASQGDVEEYDYGHCVIRADALRKGIEHYDMYIKIFFAHVIKHNKLEMPIATADTDEWVDLAGLLAPQDAINRLVDKIREGDITTVEEIEYQLRDIHCNYDDYCWNYAYNAATRFYGLSHLTESDAERLLVEGRAAREQMIDAIADDARREYRLGDVSEDTLDEFIDKLPLP